MGITALWVLVILFHSHVNQASSGMNLMAMVEVLVQNAQRDIIVRVLQHTHRQSAQR